MYKTKCSFYNAALNRRRYHRVGFRDADNKRYFVYSGVDKEFKILCNAGRDGGSYFKTIPDINRIPATADLVSSLKDAKYRIQRLRSKQRYARHRWLKGYHLELGCYKITGHGRKVILGIY